MTTTLTTTNREPTIVRILERFHDLTDTSGRQGQGSGGLVPLLRHERHCAIFASELHGVIRCTCAVRSVTEVERLLHVMRESRFEPLIELRTGEKVSVRKLRWHVIAWHVDATTIATWKPKRIIKGRRRGLPQGQDILRNAAGKPMPAELHTRVIRDSAARKDLADRGVTWIAQHWTLELEPVLPHDIAA